MVLILLLDYVDLAHSMDSWLVYPQVSLFVLICPSKPGERRKYCFSSTDKDESVSLTDVSATGDAAAAILSLTAPSLLSPGSAGSQILSHSIVSVLAENWVEWVSEWVREWVSGWMSEWVGEWVDGWVSEWMCEWVGEWVSERERGCVSEWVGGWISECTDEWLVHIIILNVLMHSLFRKSSGSIVMLSCCYHKSVTGDSLTYTPNSHIQKRLIGPHTQHTHTHWHTHTHCWRQSVTHLTLTHTFTTHHKLYVDFDVNCFMKLIQNNYFTQVTHSLSHTHSTHLFCMWIWLCFMKCKIIISQRIEE